MSLRPDLRREWCLCTISDRLAETQLLILTAISRDRVAHPVLTRALEMEHLYTLQESILIAYQVP